MPNREWYTLSNTGAYLAMLMLFILPGANAAAPQPLADCPALFRDRLAPAREILLVTTAGWSATPARLSRFVRTDSRAPWVADGPAAEAVVGRRGLAWGHGFGDLAGPQEPRKSEGDGRTPAGVYRLGRRFGLTEAGGGDFLHLDAETLCIDDPRSRHYNRIIDGGKLTRDWSSAERMGTVRLYRRGIELVYPSSAKDRAGSCIFIHEWEGPGRGTAGCIAAAPETLELLHHQPPPRDAAPVVAILPAARIAEYAACWPEIAAAVTARNPPPEVAPWPQGIEGHDMISVPMLPAAPLSPRK